MTNTVGELPWEIIASENIEDFRAAFQQLKIPTLTKTGLSEPGGQGGHAPPPSRI